MKDNLIWLVLNMMPITLAIGSVILAYNQIQGWGWFLLCSLLTAVYPTSKKS